MDDLMVIGFWLSAFAAFATLLWVLPECRVSSYKTQLWRLRDEIVDRTIAGDLRPTAAASDFVADIELRIQAARDLKPSRAIMLWLGLRLWPTKIPMARQPATKADREALHQYYVEVQRLDVKHFLTGSISGVLLLVLTLPVAVYFRLATLVRKDGHRENDSNSDGLPPAYTERVERIANATIKRRPARELAAACAY